MKEQRVKGNPNPRWEPPKFSPEAATFNANMRLRQFYVLPPYVRVRLYDAADCASGYCDLRDLREKRAASAGMRQMNACTECGLPMADWDHTHQLFETWSGRCPNCKARYISEDAADVRRMDV